MKSPGEVTQANAWVCRTGQLWQRLAGLWRAVRFSHAPKRLRVLETLQLGEKRQLLGVAVGERELLVGAAANFLATLAELPAEEKEPDAE